MRVIDFVIWRAANLRWLNTRPEPLLRTREGS
jgi:hypothetical protein